MPVFGVFAIATGAVALIVLVSIPSVLASRRASRDTAGAPRTLDWLSAGVFWLGLASFVCTGAAWLLVWLIRHPAVVLGRPEAPEELGIAAFITSVAALAPAAVAVLAALFALPGRAANPRKYGRLLGLYGLKVAIASAAGAALIIAAG